MMRCARSSSTESVMALTQDSFEVPCGTTARLVEHRRPTTVDLVVPLGTNGRWTVTPRAAQSWSRTKAT